MAPRARKLSPDQIDPRNSLQYYTREAVKNADYWDDAAVRAEYSRLRDIAQKRLKRLAKAEPDSYAYRHNVGKYKPARGQSTEELRALLPDLAKFIAARTGSVSGIIRQRKLAIAKLQEHGYYGIDMANIKEFGEYMEEMRHQKMQRSYGSSPLVNLFIFTQRNDIPWESIKDDFDVWLKNREDLESYAEKINAEGDEVSSVDIVERLDVLTGKLEEAEADARRQDRKDVADGKITQAEADQRRKERERARAAKQGRGKRRKK